MIGTMGKKFIGKFTIFFLLLNCAALGTTIHEAVITALETHPSIGMEEATAKADDIAIDAARAGYLPSLNIVSSSVGYQKYKINTKLKPPLSFPEKGSATQVISNPTVILSQTIFDGFATTYAVELAQQQAEAAYAILGQTREQVAYNAITAYNNLLTQQRLLELAQEIIQKHLEILEKVKKRVTGGISTIADVYQVESRLEQAIVVKEKTEGQLEVAFANFIEAVGFKPDDDLETPHLPEEIVLSDIECILSRVSQNNPAVVVEENNLKVAVATLDQTLSPFLPTIRAQLVSNAPIVNLQGTTGHQSSYTAQLVLDYNLFSGGKDWSNLKAQQQRVYSSMKRVDVAKRNAAKVTRTAWGTYVSDKKQIQTLQENVAVNTKLNRAYELQFELVSRPLLDLLDAYVSYYRSKNDLINAEAEKNNNHALLLASMGDLVCSVAPAESNNFAERN
jgi:adhesin transport system outer membrane protein